MNWLFFKLKNILIDNVLIKLRQIYRLNKNLFKKKNKKSNPNLINFEYKLGQVYRLN